MTWLFHFYENLTNEWTCFLSFMHYECNHKTTKALRGISFHIVLIFICTDHEMSCIICLHNPIFTSVLTITQYTMLPILLPLTRQRQITLRVFVHNEIIFKFIHFRLKLIILFNYLLCFQLKSKNFAQLNRMIERYLLDVWLT